MRGSAWWGVAVLVLVTGLTVGVLQWSGPAPATVDLRTLPINRDGLVDPHALERADVSSDGEPSDHPSDDGEVTR